MNVSIHRTSGEMLKEEVSSVDAFEGRVNYCNVLLVAGDLKPVTHFLLNKNRLEDAKKVLDELGLIMVVSELTTYAGGHDDVLVYISKDPAKADEAHRAERAIDHTTLGKLLGYPECCIKFFTFNYEKARVMHDDYTLLALERTALEKYAWQLNTSLRYLDLSLLSHFPCSYQCAYSLDMAKRFAERIRRCAPHLYDDLISGLPTAVLYDNETGVHAFEGVEYTDKGFRYGSVRLTRPNEVHDLLIQGDNIEVKKGYFIVKKGDKTLREMEDPWMGILQFNKI